eukprot:1142481-Pelagomonas_calceolata.AAC.1
MDLGEPHINLLSSDHMRMAHSLTLGRFFIPESMHILPNHADIMHVQGKWKRRSNIGLSDTLCAGFSS